MQVPKKVLELEKISLAAPEAFNFRNSRHTLGDLTDLTQSIVTNGLWNAPIVAEYAGPDDEARYFLVSGFRRVTAIKQERARMIRDAGTHDGWFDYIECCVIPADPIDRALAVNISENEHREPLNLADKCEAVAHLTERLGTQIEAAAILNISQPYVSILCSTYYGLCVEAFTALRGGFLSMAQARKLVKIKNDDGSPNIEGQLRVLRKMLGSEEDENDTQDTVEDVEPKRALRSKKEVKKLLTLLTDDYDPSSVDPLHRASLLTALKWFTCEIELEELLLGADIEALGSIESEEQEAE